MDGEDGSELLFGHDLGGGRGVGDDGGGDEVAFTAGGFRVWGFGGKSEVVVLTVGEEGFDFFVLHGVLDGSDLDVLVG